MFHPVGHYCMDYCCRVQVRSLSLHVDVIPHRNSPPVIRLRPAWQEGRRHPAHHPDQFLQHAARTDRRRAGHPEGGGIVFPSLEAAVLGALRRLGMPRILGRKAERNRILSRGVGRRTEMRNGRRNPAGPTSATKTTSASTGNNQQIRQSAVVAVHNAWMMDRVRDPGNAGS